MNIQRSVMRSTWFPVLAALLLAPASAGAQNRSAALHDGVVVDPASGTAYVASPSGEMVAIDLASGRRIWASDRAARPLAIAGDTLVAQAAPGAGEQLAIVSVDKRNGQEKRRSNVALPGTLRAGVISSPSQKTVVEGTLDATGDVVVSWAIEPRVARGANPDDGSVEPVLGAARVDPDTGEVAALPVTEPPDSGALSNLTPSQMTELRSIDGQHVLRSQRSSDPSEVRMPYRWTITRVTGEVVGVFDAPTSAAPFVVHGSQVLHVAQAGGYRAGNRFVSEPLRVRAIDLASGAELWTVPVLDAGSLLSPP